MTRSVPDRYVLLEDAYKHLIGEECEFVDVDCRLTSEEKRFIELKNKKDKIEADCKKDRKPYPEEHRVISDEINPRRALMSSVEEKIYRHEEFQEHANERIRQVACGGGLNPLLITSKKEKYPLIAKDFIDHYAFDEMCLKSESKVNVPSDDPDIEKVVRGHVVVSEKSLLLIKKDILPELIKYNKSRHSNPNRPIEFHDSKSNEKKHSGGAGRPTSWDHVVEPYFKERMANKECKDTAAEEGKYLSKWLSKEYPDEAQLKPRSMTNKLLDAHRAYKTKLIREKIDQK